MEQRLERVFSEARAKVLTTNSKVSIQVGPRLTLAVCRRLSVPETLNLDRGLRGFLSGDVEKLNQVHLQDAGFISRCLQQIGGNEAVWSLVRHQCFCPIR